MVNIDEESEDEAEEVEMGEETRRKKKKRRSAAAFNVGETSSSKSPMKTGRRREDVWKYVEKLEGNRFRCKRCKQEYSGGATRIKIHLAIINGTGIKRCEKLRKRKKKKKKHDSFPPFVQEGTDNVAITASSPERDVQSDANNPAIPLSPISLHPCPDPNPTVSLLPSPSCLQDTSHIKEQYKELVKHLVVSNVPFPTSHSSLFKEALQSLEMEVEQHIQIVKESWRKTGCTLKIHWKESRYDEFPEKSDIVGYSVYCPKGLIFLDSLRLFAEVEKAMEKEVTQILCDLDHENEHQQALFLCASNMVITRFSTSISICAHGEILRLLHRVGEESNWLTNLLKEAKNMYEVLCRRGKKILVASKFEHPFAELQAIVHHKKELESVFRNRSETFWKKFWKDTKETLNAIGPLIHILSIFDCFVPNIGYFYKAIEMAEKRIEHRYEAKPQKFKELWVQFGLLKSCVIQPIHVTSAYLNPSYMYNELSNEDKINDQEVTDYIKEFLNKSKEEEALENELAKYQKKDSSLFTEEAISMLITYHPVRWWEEFGEPTPILRQCAIRLLSQPSNCLSHFCHKPKFEALKFEGPEVFGLNVTMMEEFMDLEKRDAIFEPIDLGVIDEPLN